MTAPTPDRSVEKPQKAEVSEPRGERPSPTAIFAKARERVGATRSKLGGVLTSLSRTAPNVDLSPECAEFVQQEQALQDLDAATAGQLGVAGAEGKNPADTKGSTPAGEAEAKSSKQIAPESSHEEHPAEQTSPGGEIITALEKLKPEVVARGIKRNLTAIGNLSLLGRMGEAVKKNPFLAAPFAAGLANVAFKGAGLDPVAIDVATDILNAAMAGINVANLRPARIGVEKIIQAAGGSPEEMNKFLKGTATAAEFAIGAGIGVALTGLTHTLGGDSSIATGINYTDDFALSLANTVLRLLGRTASVLPTTNTLA